MAERQHSIISKAQALSCGLSDDEIDSRLARHVWIRLHRSAYKIAIARVEKIRATSPVRTLIEIAS